MSRFKHYRQIGVAMAWRVSLSLYLLLISVLPSCERGGWENSFNSPSEIGHAVVEALNKGDASGLHQLRVSRKEYLTWMWPAFPASGPPHNYPEDFAWSNLDAKCSRAVRRLIKRYGESDFVFAKLDFERKTEKYKDFQLLRGTVLTVENKHGQQKTLKILGSVVEKDGRYKLLSYKD